MPKKTKWITYKSAAKKFKVAVATVRRLASQGKVRKQKTGKLVRVNQNDMEREVSNMKRHGYKHVNKKPRPARSNVPTNKVRPNTEGQERAHKQLSKGGRVLELAQLLVDLDRFVARLDELGLGLVSTNGIHLIKKAIIVKLKEVAGDN